MKFKKIPRVIDSKRRALVMDDDKTLRLLILSMLEECGYIVFLTQDGEETLRQYQRAKDSNFPFDLVILDLDNPSGKAGETMNHLLDMDPAVKALALCDVHHQLLSDDEKHGFGGVLAKPFTVKELDRALAEIRSGRKTPCRMPAERNNGKQGGVVWTK